MPIGARTNSTISTSSTALSQKLYSLGAHAQTRGRVEKRIFFHQEKHRIRARPLLHIDLFWLNELL